DEVSVTMAGGEVGSACAPSGGCSVVSYSDTFEAAVCIDVIKANRPQSPYSKVEGCIDCHIAGAVDALDKALERNVTPLKNTMNAFSLSTGWGPSFSFDLNIAVKTVVQYTYEPVKSWAASVMESMVDAMKDEENAALYTKDADRVSMEKEKQQALLEKIEGFSKAADAAADDALTRKVKPMLGQMKESFKRLNGQWNALALMGFDKMKECK
ncbi:hypothetical protein JXA05_00075, partial [Candidatus Peregrinibacteria bacterium]|nr:hypothetical protein [Candidatus Peregrinibacteria bacterium]